jgi:phosphate transport system protein
MVSSAIDRAVDALRDQDVTAAQRIVEEDQLINNLRYEIESLCVAIIATQQPVASDLRTVIAVTHIAVELERMADHAAGIATLVTRMADEPLLKPLIDIPRMARVVQEMLRAGIRAFMDNDLEAARRVIERDDEVDQLYAQVFRELLTYMLQNPRNIKRATYLLWIAHGLERIGDRITNVGERIVFMRTGYLKGLEKDA